MKKGNVRVILIVAVLVSFLSGSVGTYFALGNGQDGIRTVVQSGSIQLNEESSIAPGVDQIYDAVVVVEGFRDGKLVSTGTGFIYKKDNDNAYIMTNHHVLGDATSVKVILSDHREVEAVIKGSEVYSDIGVLAVTAKSVSAVATLGDSTKLRVGDALFTVGSPEGVNYAGTVTTGILSGKDRLVAVALSNNQSSDYYMKVLQTDAAINPGNSGGPICNMLGEVIGITNMKLVDSTVEGIGFAIPIEDALYYAATLEKGEDVVRPYLGIEMLDLTNRYYLWQQGIQIADDVQTGVVVMGVVEGSPASVAGLQKGDIITSLGSDKVTSVASFRYSLYKHAQGETVKIQYVRKRKVKTVEVILGSK